MSTWRERNREYRAQRESGESPREWGAIEEITPRKPMAKELSVSGQKKNYRIGDSVFHVRLGAGTVVTRENGFPIIRFHNSGKRLALIQDLRAGLVLTHRERERSA